MGLAEKRAGGISAAGHRLSSLRPAGAGGLFCFFVADYDGFWDVCCTQVLLLHITQ